MRDLQGRRVAPGLAERTVARVYADADETELVTQFLERKYRRESLPRFFQEEKNVAAAYRRLRAAGFSTGASVRVLKRYSSAAEAIEESDQDTI
jgi:regulatory protein